MPAAARERQASPATPPSLSLSSPGPRCLPGACRCARPPTNAMPHARPPTTKAGGAPRPLQRLSLNPIFHTSGDDDKGRPSTVLEMERIWTGLMFECKYLLKVRLGLQCSETARQPRPAIMRWIGAGHARMAPPACATHPILYRTHAYLSSGTVK